MKLTKNIRSALLFVGASVCSITTLALTETVNGITWTYTVSNGKAAVGSGEYGGSTAVPTTTTGAITIPSSLGGYDVTNIGNFAFSGCSGLTSVTIPDGVTSIDSGAFQGCSRLANVAIPNSVISINSSAFYNCTNIVNATVPGWKCYILYFYRVTNLVISAGTTNIRASAFSSCEGLTQVTIPNSVTDIGNSAFSGCSGLTSVTIPNGVTNIGNSAFSGCSGLTSVTIPSSVTRIGDSAFRGCRILNFVVDSQNPSYKSVCGLLLTKNGERLVQGINADVVIPDTVVDISDYAFSACSGLTSVTIPSSVTSIGQGAFYGCSGLTSVTIPNSVTNIGAGAFQGCTELTSVTIPDSVNAVTTWTFDGCNKLWSNWYRTLANISAAGGEFSGGGVSSEEMPYALTNAPMDRAIASVTVNEDCAIDEFVLKDGKVYDSVICVKNTSDGSVSLSLPSGYSYVTVAGQRPLTIPANSTCLVSITRIAERKFLVSRQQLEEL